MATSVYCIAPTFTLASNLVTALTANGFSSNDISVIMPDKSGTRDFAHERHTKAPEGAAAGAGAGGVVGGALGLLAGIGALAIPGVGPLIAAGPIMAALSGAAVGAAVGGLTGTLVGLGIPEYEAKMFEGKIKGGAALISVHAENDAEVTKAKRVLKDGGGEDIGTASEASVTTRPIGEPRVASM